MNLSKLYVDISAHSALDTQVLERFVRQNDAFFQALTSDVGEISSYEAIDALSLVISAESYFTSTQEWEQLVLCCLERIRNGIYQRELMGIYAYSGLSHVCFVIRELVNKVPSLIRFRDGLESMLADQIRLHLGTICDSHFSEVNHLELINGLAGVLRYCCDGEAEGPCQTFVNEVADTLISRLQPKKFQGRIAPGFHYIPLTHEARYMSTPAPNGCINYSMSHGTAGTLGALSFAYRKTQRPDIRSAMESLIAEFLHAQFYVNGIAYWPGRIKLEQYMGQEEIPRIANRMSWCYGSPGILRALYLAADALGREDIKRFAQDEMAKIAAMDTSGYGLDSPIICHGLAGVALVMRNMYADTQNEVFAAKSNSLTDAIVYNFSYHETENHGLTGVKEVRKYNYLEGYTGILQTIYSVMTGEANVNEKRLLLR